IRSLPETSALLPSDTKLEIPQPLWEAWSSTAMPTAPDCEATASPPARGGSGAKLASSLTFGSVLMTPRQFGPTSRIPAERAIRTSSAWLACPAAPVSENPAVSTTAARVPAWVASLSTPATWSAGTAITTSSAGPGNSERDGYAGTPAITEARGLTGYTGPAKP